jgi:hypothetical protein
MEFLPKHKETECAILTETICSPEHVIDTIRDDILDNYNVNNVNNLNKNKIIEESKKKYSCDDEACVIEKLTVQGKISPIILNTYFKQVGPRNNTDLLSNVNIDNVIAQWVNLYKTDFSKVDTDKLYIYHVPFQMRDFQDTNSELNNIDIYSIAKKYDCLVVVFNTDYSNGPGIHWFCHFYDFKSSPITLEYFNSSGHLPLPEIQTHLFQTKHKLIESKMDTEIIIVSKFAHQQGNTECGVYSLYYIWSRINGVSWQKFNKKRISDQKMIEFRKVIFRS